MNGEPTHFELGVADAGKATELYSRLLGWTVHPMGDGGGWIEAGGVRGGLHGGDPDGGMVLYFRAPDIEAALQTVKALGGQPGEASPGRAPNSAGSPNAVTIRAPGSARISISPPRADHERSGALCA